jgi:YYY domain-containing protein
MLHFVLWYILISLIGLLTFPLAYWLLPALVDRGYVFSRALGWLLWGYLFWLLGTLGLLQNDYGGELVALLLLLGAVGWALRKTGWRKILAWMRAEKRLVLTVEILFLVAFGGWTLVRAANPQIVGTEKPMELAFINAILRSPTLPPIDPWLSGFSISYYYFGYILVAMLARLAGTSGNIAFNLGGSLVFGLSAVGSFGLLYNLLAHRSKDTQPPASRSPFSALLAPFFVLIVSNLGGLLQLMRLGGVFWRTEENGQVVSPIWHWLDMGTFSQPPPAVPFPHWWWWQSSRVVQDFDFNGVNKGDIIDEFPFFSFLLADLHPHVLAMPFAFLVMAVAFHIFIRRSETKLPWLNLKLRPEFFALSAILVGGMAFLNTWDAPFYMALFAGAYLLGEGIKGNSWQYGWDLFKGFLGFGLKLGLAAIALYLPFYLSFSSQAGGIIPNLIYVTRGVYFWIMFIPFLLPLLVFVIHTWRQKERPTNLNAGLKWTLILILILWAVSLLVTAFISLIGIFARLNPEAAVAAETYLNSMAAPSWRAVLGESLLRRVTAPGTWLTLLALISLSIAALWPARRDETASESRPLVPRHGFVFLLIILGGLLTLGPEFLFLRDMFGYRINTIFKFYFLAWLMWAVAAAYASVFLWSRLEAVWRYAFRVAMVLVIGLCLLYPAMGLWTKTDNFSPAQWTLDGTAYFKNASPDEAAAIAWLQDAPMGVVAEAVGGSFSDFGRVSSQTGYPTVLGWEFHEIQWRGDSSVLGTRKADIERLYCIPSWPEAQQVIDLYDIRYIFIGGKERLEYVPGGSNCTAGLSEDKFARNLPIAFQQGSVVIYEIPWQE